MNIYESWFEVKTLNQRTNKKEIRRISAKFKILSVGRP